MRQTLRKKYLSAPRFNRYRIATDGDISKAKRLYNANIRLSQSFHPILSQFEVTLRNTIDSELTNYFGDKKWIINEKNGFMNDASLRPSSYYLKNQVLKSERKFTKIGVPIISSKVLADQSFGFWVHLFLPHHFSLLSATPIKIFQYLPATENRRSIYRRLDKIRKFRNRVNHCEPICFNSSNVDCAHVQTIRNFVYDLIQWIEPDLRPFFQKRDNFGNKVACINNI